jgi:tRNA(Ile2) C34 agmatinyltransferase TiaS
MTARGFLDPLDWMWRNGLAHLSSQRTNTSSALAGACGAPESSAGATRVRCVRCVRSVRSTRSSKLLYEFPPPSSQQE